jgi:hypothetical protein
MFHVGGAALGLECERDVVEHGEGAVETVAARASRRQAHDARTVGGLCDRHVDSQAVGFSGDLHGHHRIDAEAAQAQAMGELEDGDAVARLDRRRNEMFERLHRRPESGRERTFDDGGSGLLTARRNVSHANAGAQLLGHQNTFRSWCI